MCRSFTAEEALGYIRLVRPGSVIGPQQAFLREIQPLMWSEGDAWRSTGRAGGTTQSRGTAAWLRFSSTLSLGRKGLPRVLAALDRSWQWPFGALPAHWL
jgi:hypothetical protein